jgi:hypothetical protein
VVVVVEVTVLLVALLELVVHLAVVQVEAEMLLAVQMQTVAMELYVLFGDLVDHTLYMQMLHLNLQSIIL